MEDVKEEVDAGKNTLDTGDTTSEQSSTKDARKIIPNNDLIEVQTVEEIGEESTSVDKTALLRKNRKIRPRRSKISILKVEKIQPKKIKLKKNAEKTVKKVYDRAINQALLDNWRHILDMESMVKCPLTKCQLVYTSIAGLQYHYTHCSGVSDSKSFPRCEICDFLIPAKQFVATHMERVHGIAKQKTVKSRSPSPPDISEAQPLSNKDDPDPLVILTSRTRKRPTRYLADIVDDNESLFEFEEVDVPVKDPKVPRKRGKPKICKKPMLSETTDEPVVVKRSRGRPPGRTKKSRGKFAGLVDEDNECLDVIGKGEQEEEQIHLEGDSVVVQETDGDKLLNLQEANEPSAALEDGKTEEIQLEDGDLPLKKRKRGRPPKSRKRPKLTEESSVAANSQTGEEKSQPEEIPSVTTATKVSDKMGENDSESVNAKPQEIGEKESAGKPKRGRKPKKKVRVRKSNKKAINNDNAPAEVKNIICPICKKEFSGAQKKIYNLHTYTDHNGLVRTPDEEPYTAKEKFYIFKECVRIMKQIRCLNENCGKAFSTPGGYVYHADRCGSAPELFEAPCKVCGKVLKIGSIASHMKSHHPPSPPQSPPRSLKDTEEEKPDGVRKRKAAVAARNTLKELLVNDTETQVFTEKCGTEKDDSYAESDANSESDHDDDACHIESASGKKKRSGHISKQMFADWKKELESTGQVKCKRDDCSQVLTSIALVRNHYYICKLSKTFLYQCDICDYKCNSDSTFTKHVRQIHSKAEEKGQDFEGDPLTVTRLRKNKIFVSPYDIFLPSGPTRMCLNFELFCKAPAPKFYLNNYSDVLFPDWKPLKANWELMTKKQYEDYLPVCNESVEFTSTRRHFKSKHTWKSLKKFEAISEFDNDSWTMFSGGPVKSCAWVTTPMNTTNAEQYLAVGVNHDMDSYAKVLDQCTDKGIMELWTVGCLDNLTLPTLCLVIAHEAGIVWEIAWCPSGCWEYPDTGTNDDDIVLPRLGLMASAHSDGLIRIYACPRPNSLPTPEAGELRVCHPKPNLILKLARNTEELENLQCVCMSWFQGGGHGTIAAGFNTGFLGIWDLDTKSPLLISEDGGSKLIYATQVVKAHAAVVTGVDFNLGSNGRFVATCSRDRHIKLWDRQNIEIPQNDIFRKFLNGLSWSHLWSGLINYGDKSGKSHNILEVSYTENGYSHSNSTVVSYHDGTVWDTSVSIFYNGTASCDDSGYVVLSLMAPVVQFHMKSSRRRVQLRLLYVRRVKKSGEDDETTVNVDTYKKSVKSHRLVFEEKDWSKPLEMQSEQPKDKIPMDYPISSVNRVRWNPNVGYSSWIACGCHNGLIKVLQVGKGPDGKSKTENS